MPDSTKAKIAGTDTKPEIFHPKGKQNGGGIVIAHGSDGLVDNEHGKWRRMIMEYAKELSDKGFVVVVPNYFAITKTKPPSTATPRRLARSRSVANCVGGYRRECEQAEGH